MDVSLKELRAAPFPAPSDVAGKRLARVHLRLVVSSGRC
jgi:hypothetical protein